MTTQEILLVALAAMVVLLAYLLIPRLVRERRQAASIKRMRLEDFSAFLRTNSAEGAIVEVARKVSDLLINSFGCEQILFVRKKRGALELNYYHGLRNFNRHDLILPHSKALADLLRADFLPRPLDHLVGQLPGPFVARLREHQIDAFFPIFWKENLYGIYFIHSNETIMSPSFNLLVAGMAQSLSAAYHIKWHETKYEALKKQVDTLSNLSRRSLADEPTVGRMLKLVQHRNSETIIPQIMENLRSAAGLRGMAYLYEGKNNDHAPLLFQEGMAGSVDVPDASSFQQILKEVTGQSYYDLEKFQPQQPATSSWVRELRRRGFKYVSRFPLAPDREGVLAWRGGRDVASVQNQLELFKAHTYHLIENAESFEKMEEMSHTDSLTGLANQRYFFKRLEEEISRAERYNRSLALIIFDQDELKSTNDTYGHLAGDAVLKQMGDILRKSIRAIDVIARYGGDEFCVIMPEADSDMCAKFMSRLQSKIAHSRFAVEGIDQPLTCTVSMGGAVYPDHAENAKKLIFAADMALLKAKETGRDKSLMFSEIH